MVNQISPPFPVFHDQNGEQLVNGFVYIGEANQNPETNPANVFWDEAMTQAAQQPLRTTGGRFTRNGSPANVFTPSAYSITVREANRRIVYSDLNISSVGTQNMFLGVVPQATLSVSSNSINLASATGGARDILVTSTGNAATLNTISGGTLGEFLTIRPDVGRTITVVHNASAAGNEIYLPRGENVSLNGNEVTLLLRYDGSNWIAQGGTAIGNQTFQLVNDTTPQLGGVLDTNSRQVRFSRGPDVTAEATLSLSPTGNSYDVVGTGSISGIANVAVGVEVRLTFTSTPQLINGANFILPSGANIATAAGDVADFEQISSSPIRWRCTNYEPASGAALTGGGTEVLLARTVVSSATPSVEFTSAQFDASRYDSYVIRYSNVTPTMNDVGLQVRTSNTGNAPFDQGATDYGYAGVTVFDSGFVGNASSPGASSIFLTLSGSTGGVGSDTGDGGASGMLNIFAPHLSRPTYISAETTYFASQNRIIHVRTGGQRNEQSTVTAIEFRFDSGNIESGIFTITGINNS